MVEFDFFQAGVELDTICPHGILYDHISSRNEMSCSAGLFTITLSAPG